MKKIGFGTAMALVALMPAPTLAKDRPVVSTESGKISGVRSGDIIAYKGIPYAAPPVGEGRWRAPAPVSGWLGLRPVTDYGADCEHSRRDWEADRANAPMGEDCLYLNVWTPAKPVKGGAPVLFWIHGGSFTAGSGAQRAYDGAKLAARGAVVVTFNYRLGRFGFFAHPALTPEAGTAATGNWGLMDQLAALRWVQKNIAAFGGDPKNVTIFGESAGGGSVNQMMVMPAAQGLFAKAIAQSGGGRDDGVSLADAEAKGAAFAQEVGVAGNDTVALRAIPADKVRGKMTLLNTEAKTYSGPMIDGRLVQGRVDVPFLKGQQAKVPYMVGANSYEIGFLPEALRGVFTTAFGGALGTAQAEVKTAYGSAETYEQNLVGDAMFAEPARFLAGLAAPNGSYLYRFDYVPTAKRGTDKGAPHGVDVYYVFGNLEDIESLGGIKTSAEDHAMAKLVGDYWVAFAKTGNPNGPGRPAWPRFAPEGERLHFTASGTKAESARSAALDVLARFAEAKREAAR